MPYAVDTSVPVERSKMEIERTITRYGASEFVQGTSAAQALVGFKAHARYVRIRIRLPRPEDYRGARKYEQELRRIWRAVVLVIKAKLESVDSGIETFEDAFLPHIVMPDGKTLSEHVIPMIAQAYKAGKMVPLLPGLGETGNG